MKKLLIAYFTLIVAMPYTFSQCPEFTTMTVVPNCIPSCELCVGDQVTINLAGNDLIDGSKVDWYFSPNAGFDPYAGQGTLFGSSNVSTPSNTCRQCPALIGILIDACGTEQENEFIVIYTGSGFNTSTLNVDYATQNNGGAGNADIGGGCGLVSGNPGLISCAATAVGSGYNLPPDAILVVFTSSAANFVYDFSAVCGLGKKIFVTSSSCARSIGAFSNVTATGVRTQGISLTGCGACSSVVTYDTDDPALMGEGDNWAGGIGNDGCACPGVTPPAYIKNPSTITPFSFTIPKAWCDKTYEIVGIANPKPDPMCCVDIFTERFEITVKCPLATTPSPLEACDMGNGTAFFNLTDKDLEILGGGTGSVEYYSDAAGTIKISSPYLSGNKTIFARITDGKCKSDIVQLELKVLALPIAQRATIERCDEGGRMASIDLDALRVSIAGPHPPSSVKFYLDAGKTIEITINPFVTGSTTIYATVSNGACESLPVPIVILVTDAPRAISVSDTLCTDTSGKAIFTLINLTNKINNNSGGTVRFFEDLSQSIEINPPYTTARDTIIYAVVNNGKCISEPVEVRLHVTKLNAPRLLTENVCASGSGLFDLLDLSKKLKGTDTSIQILWFHDKGKLNPFNPPISINGKDTVYAILKTRLCESSEIEIILESVTKPIAFPYSDSLCADANGIITLLESDLKLIINSDPNFTLQVSKTSSFDSILQFPYFGNDSLLYAKVLNGSCASDSTLIKLTIRPPAQFTMADSLYACDHLVLPQITGLQLSGNSKYALQASMHSPNVSAGDTIRNSTTLYLSDSLFFATNAICYSNKKIQIIIEPELDAGLDQRISICDGNQFDLISLLNGIQVGGNFRDLDNSGSLTGTLFNSTGKSGNTYRFSYTLTSLGLCPNDSSILQIAVVKSVSAGQDTSITLCKHETLDLQTILRSADGGGSYTSATGSAAINGTLWNSNLVNPGMYIVTYQIGDGVVCPIDLSQLTITVKDNIDIQHNGDQTICDYYILPAIVGKNTSNAASYFSSAGRNGQQFNAGDTIKQSLQLFINEESTSFCYDEDTIRISILQTQRSSFIQNNICAERVFTINGKQYSIQNPSGTETVSKGSSNGCDSIINIQLQFLPVSRSDFNARFCPDQNITINNKIYNILNPIGTELLRNASQFGCDSTVNINLTFHPITTELIRPVICENDSIRINSTNYHKLKLSGSDTLKNGSLVSGCDSIIRVDVQLISNSTHILQQKLCNGNTLTVNNTVYDQNKPTGTEILNNASANGCDSIIQVNLSFSAGATSQYNQTICYRDSLFINGEWYHSRNLFGVDTFFKATSGGCDSIVQIAIQELPESISSLKDTFCSNEFIVIAGQRFDKDNPTGIRVINNGSSNQCDSTLIVDLSFLTYQFTFTPTYTLNPGTTVIFDIQTDMQVSTIQWSPGSGLSCTDCLNPTLTATTSEFYTITITDKIGCSLTGTIRILVETSEDVWAPNAISLDNNRINDGFKIISNNSSAHLDVLEIYDRWGEQLYHEENTLLSVHKGWDGTFKGKSVQPGVYVYRCVVTILGKQKLLVGDITVLH